MTKKLSAICRNLNLKEVIAIRLIKLRVGNENNQEAYFNGLECIICILVYEALCDIIELIDGVVRPPVSQGARLVIESASVVDSMSHLMSDDHPDRAEEY